jgi:hypothetical protein
MKSTSLSSDLQVVGDLVGIAHKSVQKIHTLVQPGDAI